MHFQKKQEHHPDLSVVVPVYNEEGNVGPLLEEIDSAITALGKSYEVLFVDDKSTDSSLEVLQGLKNSNPAVRILKHGINSGESAAMITGFSHAKADVVITMDADQQNDPADIPRLLENLVVGIDAVCGVRRTREDDWVKRLSSRIANAFRNGVTGDKISDAGCTYRALRREALHEILPFNGLHRFLPTILRFQGYGVVEILVNHRPRTRGVSKYGVGNRAWRGIVDCMAMRWYRKRRLAGKRFETEL